MERTSISDYNQDKFVTNTLTDAIKKNNQGISVMMQLPIDNYIMANISSVKQLTDNNFKGVYISTQRPYNNMKDLFSRNGIDIKNLKIIDCINISNSKDIKIIAQSVIKSLKELKSKKKFILIDSLTTLGLYRSQEELSNFSDVILNITKKNGFENVIVLFGVAEDLSKKEFIKKITTNVDEVIQVLNKSAKYSKEVLSRDVLT